MTREACDPYGAPCPPVELGDMLARLTRAELESLACRFYGRLPGRFEELVLQFWAGRQPRG